MRTLLVLLLLPGCYLAGRGGPSYQAGGRIGFDWQVTAGVELTVPTRDQRSALDPFAGRVHVGVGAGGGEASTPTTRLTGWTVVGEGRYTLARKEWSPGDGVWLDGRISAGGGMGTSEVTSNGVERKTDGGLFTIDGAWEVGVHGGGSSNESMGLVAGLGIAETKIGDASSFSPYAEAKLEGAALAEIALAILLSAH